MRPTLPLLLFYVAALNGFSTAMAEDRATTELSSGERQVTLVELYTSEGCSSCPPADRWVTNLVDDDRLWSEIVPVSLHVDYWDWIGWRDRFADSAYSERQERHVREGNARVVYTPGFFSNGAEWPGFFDRAPLETTHPPVGELAISIDDRDVMVRFDPLVEPPGDLSVTVALLGMGLSSSVSAGENRGKTLSHDFVVLRMKERVMKDDEGVFLADIRMPRPDEEAAAIAAWVTPRDSQRPLQAVGGFLQ